MLNIDFLLYLTAFLNDKTKLYLLSVSKKLLNLIQLNNAYDQSTIQYLCYYHRFKKIKNHNRNKILLNRQNMIVILTFSI